MNGGAARCRCDGEGIEMAEVAVITGSQVNRRVAVVIHSTGGLSGRGGGVQCRVCKEMVSCPHVLPVVEARVVLTAEACVAKSKSLRKFR